MTRQLNPQVKRGSRLLVTVGIDPDQVAAIDDLAEERRTSRAQIVREAIDVFLRSLVEPAESASAR